MKRTVWSIVAGAGGLLDPAPAHQLPDTAKGQIQAKQYHPTADVVISTLLNNITITGNGQCQRNGCDDEADDEVD